MALETMEPDPAWDPAEHERVVETLARHAEAITVRIWGADWCPDCRAVLPEVAAALGAAGVPASRVYQYRVDREKDGELTEAYGIEYIPTIVIERDGEEIARFVESADVPAPTYLAERLRRAEAAR